MLSCGCCSRWQHIACHDQADVRAGRPKRNWDLVDFICHKCRVIAQKHKPARHQRGRGFEASSGGPPPRSTTTILSHSHQNFVSDSIYHHHPDVRTHHNMTPNILHHTHSSQIQLPLQLALHQPQQRQVQFSYYQTLPPSLSPYSGHPNEVLPHPPRSDGAAYPVSSFPSCRKSLLTD